MRILIQCPVQDKPDFEPVDHMIDRARSAIKTFAGDRHFEYLCITQQFEIDLADTEDRPEIQRQVCRAYIWLAKGVQ